MFPDYTNLIYSFGTPGSTLSYTATQKCCFYVSIGNASASINGVGLPDGFGYMSVGDTITFTAVYSGDKCKIFGLKNSL